MSFQWLEMRVQEERERRQREAQTLERLPAALEEMYRDLTGCIASFTGAFGADSAEIELSGPKITIVPALPGFRIDRGQGEPLNILVGVLPGDKLFYRDGEEYIGMDELSRRILDRAMFPKLSE